MFRPNVVGQGLLDQFPLFLPPPLFITKDVERSVMGAAARHHSLVLTLQCELTTHQVHQRASRMEAHVRLELGFES